MKNLNEKFVEDATKVLKEYIDKCIEAGAYEGYEDEHGDLYDENDEWKNKVNFDMIEQFQKYHRLEASIGGDTRYSVYYNDNYNGEVYLLEVIDTSC